MANRWASFGTQLVYEISDPTVIGVFRLAIAEAVHTPEVARALDAIGRETSRVALRAIMDRAQAADSPTGLPADLADQFGSLLLGDLIVSLLLGVAERPSRRHRAACAHRRSSVLQHRGRSWLRKDPVRGSIGHVFANACSSSSRTVSPPCARQSLTSWSRSDSGARPAAMPDTRSKISWSMLTPLLAAVAEY